LKADLIIPEELVDKIADKVSERLKPILLNSGTKENRDIIFTKKTLAEYLNVSAKWVDGYKELGMPCYILKGHVRFRKSQIDKWLTSKEVPMINRLDRIMKVIK
jgi:hypothetical protein